MLATPQRKFDPKRCQKTVSHSWHPIQCSRKGVIEEDQKLWCRQHAPSSVKTRTEESARRYDKKCRRERLQRERAAWEKVIFMLKERDPALSKRVEEAMEWYVAARVMFVDVTERYTQQSMAELSEKIIRIELERDGLKTLLSRNRIGNCWCYLDVDREHSELCKEIRRALGR